MIEITVPVLPESVTEGTLTTWCKQEGEHVKRDDVIAELETDKVILEIPAHDGVLSNIIVSEGSTVTSAQLLAHLKPQAVIEETVTPVTETWRCLPHGWRHSVVVSNLLTLREREKWTYPERGCTARYSCTSHSA